MIFSNVREIEMVVMLLLYKEVFSFKHKSSELKRNLEYYFDLILPKWKPITIGIFYRLPNQANFMELIVKGVSHLNLKDNEIYLLGDFNINLLQNGNYILNGKGMTASQGPVCTLTNKY